jgi:hypothetical protein
VAFPVLRSISYSAPSSPNRTVWSAGLLSRSYSSATVIFCAILPAGTGGAGAGSAAGAGQRRARRRVEPAVTPQANYRHWSPMYPAYVAPLIDTARDREVQEIATALGSAGPIERPQLASLVHAGQWGPGRFTPALRQAITQGRVHRTGKGLYALAPGAPSPSDGPPPADQAQHGDPASERP